MVEKEKQSKKPGINDEQAECLYYKIEALFFCFQEIIKLKTGLPVAPENVQAGMVFLCKATLVDLELEIFGEKIFTDTVDKE